MADHFAPDEDQGSIVAALSKPEVFAADGEVVRVETHGAIVFLVGDRAYKMKRAVRLPYMDFGSLDRRHAMCAAEVDINRLTAPELYLGVAPVLRDGHGNLRVGEIGRGEKSNGNASTIVEWLVVMRRFEQSALFVNLATAGKIDRSMAAELARYVAAFHLNAKVDRQQGGLESYRQAIQNDALRMAEHRHVLNSERIDRLSVGLHHHFENNSALISRRQRAGAVRRCHGDLHLGNICLWQGRPTLFDAIEFNPAMATIDVLYDLAFLLMDLQRRGLAVAANTVFNNWLWRIDETVDATHLEALALLPLMLARRAAIRTFVEATSAALVAKPAEARQHTVAASAYLDLALEFLVEQRPCLLAIGGLSGSGKTTLALNLAPSLGRRPGAVIVRTDVERKRLAGLPIDTPLASQAYTAQESEKVYGRVYQCARTALEAGSCVIVDGVFAQPRERAAIEALAATLGVPFAGLWLDVASERAIARVTGRSGDASDAGPSVVVRQFGYHLGDIAWHRLDAMQAEETVARRASGIVFEAFGLVAPEH